MKAGNCKISTSFRLGSLRGLKKIIDVKRDEDVEVSQCPYTNRDGIQYMLTSASSSSLNLDS